MKTLSTYSSPLFIIFSYLLSFFLFTNEVFARGGGGGGGGGGGAS